MHGMTPDKLKSIIRGAMTLYKATHNDHIQPGMEVHLYNKLYTHFGSDEPDSPYAANIELPQELVDDIQQQINQHHMENDVGPSRGRSSF